jgi:hypothetical protein
MGTQRRVREWGQVFAFQVLRDGELRVRRLLSDRSPVMTDRTRFDSSSPNDKLTVPVVRARNVRMDLRRVVAR